MDATELGAAIKRLRKNDLRMTQKTFSERTEMDLKKLSRLECGYQLPDEYFWEDLLKIGVNEERINTMRQWTDDSVSHSGLAPCSADKHGRATGSIGACLSGGRPAIAPWWRT